MFGNNSWTVSRGRQQASRVPTTHERTAVTTTTTDHSASDVSSPSHHILKYPSYIFIFNGLEAQGVRLKPIFFCAMSQGQNDLIYIFNLKKKADRDTNLSYLSASTPSILCGSGLHRSLLEGVQNSLSLPSRVKLGRGRPLLHGSVPLHW